MTIGRASSKIPEVTLFGTALRVGYYIDKGEPVSLVGAFYSDIKAKKRARVKYLKTLINHLDRDSQSKEYMTPIEAEFARFIVENLVYLDYGVTEEIFTVIHTVDRIMSSSGVSLLQSIESRDASESAIILAQRSIAFSLLVGLKQFLKMTYNLTEAKCRAFDPKKPSSGKDNKPAVRTRTLGIVEWYDIPYLENRFEDGSQVYEQLEAVLDPLTWLIIVCCIDAP